MSVWVCVPSLCVSHISIYAFCATKNTRSAKRLAAYVGIELTRRGVKCVQPNKQRSR